MTELRGKITFIINCLTCVGLEAVDEIERLRARIIELERERDELRAARMAYAKEFALNEEGEPDVGSIHANIRVLKIRVERLEAAICDKALPVIRDACQAIAIYGDQPPALYLEAIDKLNAALEVKP